ncbi:MAG: hypothetical protein JWM50_817 [Microbacteriaceae bacterium]|jgi:hypothetical protein|nr:hypothetical protein [Microbacteriaceae bacterium]
MQWWNDILNWLNSAEGARLLSTTVFPFIAIVVAGVVAALIARGSITRLFAKQERAQRASAVEALIAVGEKASQWSGLSGETRDHFEAQTSVASIRVRLLPSAGAAMASAWAEYQLAEIKRNSANFSVQADQGYAEYRDRLIEWHHRPSRARKLFVNDLERFRLDSANDDTDLIERQRRWKSEQPSAASSSTATSFSPSPANATVAPAAVSSTSRAATAPAAHQTRIDAFPTASAEPIAPVVPPASARAFIPRSTTESTDSTGSTGSTGSTDWTDSTGSTGSTQIVEATIDDDENAKAEPEKTRLI